MQIVLGLFLSVLAGLIPALIYGWFVNWLDQHEKEPWWLLALTFLWGALPAVLVSLVSQIVLDIPTTWVVGNESLAYEIVGGSLWAPITEELAKGLGVLLILLVARREFDNVLDGIVYGAMAGLGFAFSENILYFVGALVEAGWGNWVAVVLLRTIPFGLNHAFFTGLTGAGLGLARLSLRPLVKLGAPLAGLLAAMLFHALHNLGISLTDQTALAFCFSFLLDWGGILLVGVLIFLVWQQEKRWMAEQLAGEITVDAYRDVTSWWRWNRLRLAALLRADLAAWRKLGQVRQAGAELAFKKHQRARLGEAQRVQPDLDRYRQRLIALGVTPSPPEAGQTGAAPT